MTEVYRRARGAVDAVVDGQVVLLAQGDLSYHALDRVGGRVWHLLEQPRSLDDLVTVLVEDFDVTPERCRADLVPFLARLTSLGLVELTSS